MFASHRLRTALAVVLGLAWFGSLLLPAMTVDTSMDIDSQALRTLTGFEMLREGWIALSVGHFAWLGNLFLLPFLPVLTLRRPPRILSRVVAVLLMLCTLDALVLLNQMEAHAGYYLWTAINLIAALAAFLFSANTLKGPDDPVRTDRRAAPDPGDGTRLHG
jgi:hypothetical protein